MTTLTAAQAREKSKAEYNAFLAACPSQKLLSTISDKWVTLVLVALHNGGAYQPDDGGEGEPRRMRYSEIARVLAGVSPKMLTQTLRRLERDGLIGRTVTPTVPVTVSYELTTLGLSLCELVRGVKSWAQENMDTVTHHRAEYDARISA
ncbi:helix-turn-helix domain-containing protein [Gryllotalpicola koreensis]|uniref:Helix-turn-helix domain-containing protein n=1 Tax=Gryllotalpicola koreensis TaxID=993086 RepID=A0ABP8A8Q3_9MICO